MTLNTVFFEGRVYQEHIYKFLRTRQSLPHLKPFLCLVSSFRKLFTKASLLKVLYFCYLITQGLILGKCIFITATIILWKSDSPVSITVKFSHLQYQVSWISICATPEADS